MEDVKTIEMVSDMGSDLPGYVNSEYLWIQDLTSTSGNYTSGFIQFDTSGSAAMNQWIDYKASFIYMPYQITIVRYGTTSYYNQALPTDVALKNSVYSVINSINMQLGNTSVTNNATFQGVLSEWRLKTELSQDKLNQYGSLIMYAPDTPVPGAITSNTAGAYCGNNNRVLQATGSAVVAYNANFNGATGAAGFSPVLVPSILNKGFAQRAMWCNNNCLEVSSAQAFGTNGYIVNTTGSGTTQTINSLLWLNNNNAGTPTVSTTSTETWNLYLFIPLRYLHHVFEMIPNSCGLRLWMQIGVNQVQTSVIGVNSGASTGVAGNATATINGTTQNLSGSFCPFMISDAAAQAGAARFAATDQGGVYSVASRVPSQSRLYFKTVKYDPVVLAKMRFPLTRTVSYLDHLQYSLPGQLPNSQLNWQIGVSFRSVRKILIYAWANPVASGATYSANGAAGGSSINSCFCPEPMTSSYVDYTNLQLFVGGKLLRSNIEQYPIEQYQQDFIKSFLNGDEDPVFASGTGTTTDYVAYQAGVTPLVFDLSASPYATESDTNPVSLQLVGTFVEPFTNGTNSYKVDFFALVLCERYVQINQDTGSAICIASA